VLPLFDTIPRRQVPLVTTGIILLNAVVFVIELSLPQESLLQLLYIFGIVPARFSEPAWGTGIFYSVGCCWPLLTSMFLHGGWVHIISNMWTLWIFGDNVEDRMGHFRFLLFYLCCGLISAVVHILTNMHSPIPTIGASGAISGILGAYFVLFPLSQIVVLVPIFFWPVFLQVPAFVYLGLWFFTRFFSGTLSLAVPEAAGGIAWWAHIGGFVSGIVLHRLFVLRRKPRRKLFFDEYGIKGAWFDI